MKETSVTQKTAWASIPTPDLSSQPGPEGAVLAPPTCGIELVDRASESGATGLPIQPRLAVGAANDPYEYEADRVAQQVMRQLDSASPLDAAAQPAAHMPPTIQCERAAASAAQAQPQVGYAGGALSVSAEAAIQQARGGGQPLDHTLRTKMERAFSSDFSRVRVHTDGRADQLNRDIHSSAFTTGRDIFFRRGEYRPDSRGGQALLAHELTHVVQQKRSAPLIRRAITSITPTIGAVQYKPGGTVYKSYFVQVKVDDATPVDAVKLNRQVRAWSMKTSRDKSKAKTRKQTTGETLTSYDGVACSKISGNMFKDAKQDGFGPWQEDGPPESEGTNHPVKRDAQAKTVAVDDHPGLGGMDMFFGSPAEFHAEFIFTATDTKTNMSVTSNSSVDISQEEFQQVTPR